MPCSMSSVDQRDGMINGHLSLLTGNYPHRTLHFVLFVRACVETRQRNISKANALNESQDQTYDVCLETRSQKVLVVDKKEMKP